MKQNYAKDMGKESDVYGQKHNRNATDDDVDNNKHFFEIQFKQSLKPFQKVFQSPGIHFVFLAYILNQGETSMESIIQIFLGKSVKFHLNMFLFS